MSQFNCSLCGRPATASIHGDVGVVSVCRPCTVDCLPRLIAQALYDRDGAARGYISAVGGLALVTTEFWKVVAQLAAPTVPAVHVPPPDADPRLKYETSIEWLQ